MKNTRLNISIMSFPWLVLVFFLAYAFPSPPTEEWVTPYNGPGNLEDEIEALAVDASGNVYVTGQSKGNGTNWDYATIKYDPSGNELWVARYDGPSNGWDWPTGLVVDASGNAYVTGGGDAGTDGGSHFATIKYDTNGNELWVTRHHAGLNDYGTCIAVDDSGNVYVAGVTAGHYADWKIIKYDQDGNELWAEHIYLGLYSDVPSAIVVDSSGNVSVTGSRCCADMYTVKYDTNGNEIWHAQYSGTVGQAADGATDLALDSSGDIYVTGWIFNTAGDETRGAPWPCVIV